MACPSCGFGAFEVGQPVWIGVGKCLTCDFSSTVMTLECANNACAKRILLASGNECCSECGHTYTVEQVEAILEEADLLRATDYTDPGDVTRASCGKCGSYETVVPLKSDEWFCTDCFDIEAYIGQCDWCTGHSTHVPEESYALGCSQCEGRVGHEKDD